MKQALVIIDMQNDFVAQWGAKKNQNSELVVPFIQKLLNHCRKTGKDVIHVVRKHRADGSDVEQFRYSQFLLKPYAVAGTRGCDVIEELTPLPGEAILSKCRFSAFMNTEFDLILKQKKITTLVVCGIQYPNCIRSTVFDAMSLGYHVILISDATGAASEAIKQANLLDMANIGVQIKTTMEYCLMEG
jgi:nicotinamidase-related amidase